jgi:hypothetical protein
MGPLGTAATNRPIVPAPGDYDDGEIGGMMIGRGNRSTRRRPAPVQVWIILNALWYVNNHRIHEALLTSTAICEIKKWNTKYLIKLENHTNALAVNLLDNRETTHRLKRYTILTLPDKPE